MNADLRTKRLAAMERATTRLQQRITHLSQESERLSGWRFAVFLVGLLMTGTALSVGTLPAVLIAALWAAVFAGLVRAHRRVNVALKQHRAWREIKRGQIARMHLDWAAMPTLQVSAEPEHPFALDLDLVGEYSLHRLLNTAVSRGGAQRLADWLLHTQPDAETVQARQHLVRELTPLVTFRDRMTMAALLNGARGTWDGQRLRHWLAAHQSGRVAPWLLTGMIVFSTLNLILILLSGLNLLPAVLNDAWTITISGYILLSALILPRLGDVLEDALKVKAEMDALDAILRHLESWDYARTPTLGRLCAPFTDSQHKPSAQLRQITRILAALSLRANVIFWFLVNILIPWDLFFISRLGKRRDDLSELLPVWLDAWYELEALNGLANFAYLNPAYVFPTVDPAQQGFHALQIGHPHIPHEARISNDFSVPGPGLTTLITGSNMSGKSSFLRTLGVNLCLAYSGSVVAADKLETGTFRLYSSIRVSDSVTDGISYFYAEVRRLKALLDALNAADAEQPLFYLIDEIFRGTNNRERLIGSRTYIQALSAGEGMGLISTHDLELVTLADDSPRIRNMHFRESVKDEQMIFDYLLRDGPCPTTNALKIMALAGLPVENAADAAD